MALYGVVFYLPPPNIPSKLLVRTETRLIDWEGERERQKEKKFFENRESVWNEERGEERKRERKEWKRTTYKREYDEQNREIEIE